MTEYLPEPVFGNKLDPNRSNRTFGKFHGKRQVVRLTNNPSTIEPGQQLEVRLPTLGSNDVIVPGSCYLRFKLSCSKGYYPVNNVRQNILNKYEVSIDGNVIVSVDNCDIFGSYMDSWKVKSISEESSHKFGVITENGMTEEELKKRTSKSYTNDKMDETSKKMSQIYESIFYIPFDFELFTEVMPFSSTGLGNKITYRFTFNRPEQFLRKLPTTGTPSTPTGTHSHESDTYQITDIELQFTKVTSPELATSVSNAFGGTFSLLYDRILRHRVIPVNTTDQAWNWTFNTPSKSLRGILLIGKLPEHEKPFDHKVDSFWNMDITNINVTIEGVNNMIYDKGMFQYDIYDEIKRLLGGGYRKTEEIDRITKEFNLSSVNPKDFYSDSGKYAVFIDLRSVEDNYLHGSGKRFENTSEGMTLAINRKPSDKSESAKVYVYMIMDAMEKIVDGNHYSTQW